MPLGAAPQHEKGAYLSNSSWRSREEVVRSLVPLRPRISLIRSVVGTSHCCRPFGPSTRNRILGFSFPACGPYGE